MIGVSPDPIEKLHQFREANALPFPLLSDANHKVAEEYGAWGEKKRNGKAYQGMLRSHFVIDEKGRVVDAQIKVTPEESVQRALETVESMPQPTSAG